jgi:hypothetical protein
MAGTTGLEPATSAVTVLSCEKPLATLSERERHLTPMFVEVWRVFRPLLIGVSDTEQSSLTRVGMAGLRHKARHKISERKKLCGGHKIGHSSPTRFIVSFTQSPAAIFSHPDYFLDSFLNALRTPLPMAKLPSMFV